MGKPKNKEELLEASREEFQQLWTLISQMSEQEQEAEFTFPLTEKDSAAHFKRDRNLRDVLIHLYEWQNLLLNWLKKIKRVIRSYLFYLIHIIGKITEK